MLNMICSGDGGVPLFMQLGDGNESDKKVFPLSEQALMM
jgi:transposase